MKLYNTLSAAAQAALIEKAEKKRLTLSFYKYAAIGNIGIFRDHIFIAWNAIGVLGRIHVAKEGINAQLSVPADNFTAFKDHLDSISFLKLKIKVRDKILADGLNDAAFNVTDTGTHVDARTFNRLAETSDTVILDMRNHYESEIGHFKNAVTPDVDTFRDSLAVIEEALKDHKADKKLLMYCTGGIRCEKASAYYKHRGFKQVYQLEGGIINYVRQVREQGLENKFIGKNFVFDERRAERISDDVIARCHQCGQPCDTHVNCANEACNLLFIQCEACAETMNHCCSAECVTIAALPYEEQKALRKGAYKERLVFKKGRSQALSYKKA
ncbi:MAG: rhodanese-related sulfurtransferase [Sinomicrobium sp.]|nr:rhodanese-related sulfurtransferase [Sinomicrobium sp.]